MSEPQPQECSTCKFRQTEIFKAIERECESYANYYAKITSIGECDRLLDCGYDPEDVEELTHDHYLMKKAECYRQCLEAKMPKQENP